MKAVAALFFLVSVALAALIPAYGLALPSLFGIAFGIYGVATSKARHLKLLNDAPNALRVFLASAGGWMMTLDRVFLFPSVGVLLFLGSVYLNDEFQRRALHSLRKGTKGGSVALLGIDGSGKSSHSTTTSAWLEERGYRVKLMPFHRYLFVERLASISSAVRSGPRSGRRRNPLRPVVSLLDNLVLQMSSSIGCRVEGTVVIYDRFIWSTYIKYEALGYPVRPLSFLYLLPRPLFAMVLDVPVDKSLRVIGERVAHIRYPRTVLEHERASYLKIAKRNGYPVIDATRTFEEVQTDIESRLGGLFPQVQGARRR